MGALRLDLLLLRYFFTRVDVIAAKKPGGMPGPVTVPDLGAALAAHVLGDAAPAVEYQILQGGKPVNTVSARLRLGTYAPDADGKTRWLCIDFDAGPDHSDALAEPLPAAIATMEALKSYGIIGHLEQSGGGHGWHLWVFFDVPVMARDARAVALALVPRDVQLVGKGVADAKLGRGIEVFPKQDRIAANGLGNMVWLPWWSGAPEGANQFYNVTETGKAESFTPEDFTVTEASDLAVALAKLDEANAQQKSNAKSNRKGNHHAGGNGESHNWTQWRGQALRALRLEDIYGELLTGKTKGSGWLECRDPNSATGDRHPSAGVADGSADAERGSFHSFRSGETVSIFDYLMAHAGCADFIAAARKVSEASGVPLPAPAAGKGNGHKQGNNGTGTSPDCEASDEADHDDGEPTDEDDAKAKKAAAVERLRKRVGAAVCHLQFSTRGRLCCTPSNAAIILAHDVDFGAGAARPPCLGFDELADAVCWIRTPPDAVGLPLPSGQLQDHHEIYVRAWLQKVTHYDFGGSTWGGIISAARLYPFNPVVDYLNACKWDGTERLSTWVSDYMGAEKSGINCSIGRWWMISAVARAFEPGSRVDHMAIFEGGQGVKKSTALQVLADDWYSPGPERITDKDGPQSLKGRWIVEVSELAAMKGRELGAINKFITDRTDIYRPSYGRVPVTVPRRCVFAGTTNETTYLHDPTGARRFWPVRVAVEHAIDIDALQRDRDQLFAEAVQAYRDGEPWWPTGDLHHEKLTELQDARYEEDGWTDKVNEFISGLVCGYVSIDKVLTDCLLIDRGKYTRADQMRVAAILKRLKWERRKSSTGNRAWAYFKGGN